MKSRFDATNPQPPLAAATATAEQEPEAQQVLAQSASLKHCPVMNCDPLPKPTFWAPASFSLIVSEPELVVVAAEEAAGAAEEAAAVPLATKPHPPLLAATATAEQRPDAQQALAQSALLKHWPVMN